MIIYDYSTPHIAHLCRSCLREVDKKMEQVSAFHSQTESPRKWAFSWKHMLEVQQIHDA